MVNNFCERDKNDVTLPQLHTGVIAMEGGAEDHYLPTADSTYVDVEFSPDDEVLTTDIQRNAKVETLAENKLKELNDILQDYTHFNEVQHQDGAGLKGHTQNNDDTNIPMADDVFSDKQGTIGSADCTEANHGTNVSANVAQKDSTVQQANSTSSSAKLPGFDATTVLSDGSDISESVDTNSSDFQDEHGTLFVTFPDNEKCDLGDPNDHEKIVQSSQELRKAFEELKVTISNNETEIAHKDRRITKMNEHINGMQDKNYELNTKLQGVLQELAKSQETLKSHDASARAAISRLQKEGDAQINILKTKCAAMQKDKESAVMNYARREKELLDAKRMAEVADKRSKDAVKDKEKAIVQMTGMKMDMAKMKAALERCETENEQIKNHVEKWKEEANSHVIKVKWAQNKLKSETDLHNETKEKLSKAVLEIKRVKEEAQQIRRNCQGMIKTYQESEEMRSNSLDSQLKEKEMLLNEQEAKSGELEGIHKQQMDELRRLKQQHKDVLAENTVIKTRIECLEKERLRNEETLKGYTEVLNRQKREAASMGEKLKELDQMKSLICERDEKIKKVQELLERERDSCEDMKAGEEAWKLKQQELLEFTQKVSTKNAELASGNEILTSKLEKTSSDLTVAENLSSCLETELKDLKTKLDAQSQTTQSTTSELRKCLEGKEASVNHLTTQVDELKDEIRTLKRKHNASTKDLTRQLQQTRKRLEPYESAAFHTGSSPITEDGSMGSRASSDTSLECVGRTNNGSKATPLTHNSAAESGAMSNQSVYRNGTDVPETVVASTGEISTQALIERIVRLQRIHAKKNEKIDFLHDHVQQLVDEMQKKNKIIQRYILREESGLLMPDAALDHATTGDHGNSKMPRRLTEEVNRKMQSVLEDTLLKNIALKESVDALGSEIARLTTGKKL